ncbi:MAG: protein translocase subunit SecF, partial [Bacteroidales bacterium]|nr:protein translocase subunit SecF [Bacteroidales bacterium]
AIFITRLVYEWYLKKGFKVSFSTKLTEGAFKKINFDFIGKRKAFYIFSTIVVVISIASIVVRGFDYGVDFTGGRNFIIRFDKPVNTQEIAQALTDELGGTPTVIIYGDDNQVRISTRYMIDSDDPKVDEEIQNKLYTGLKQFISDDLTYDDFYNNYWQSNQKVGPTIADDIKREAVIVIFIALVFMFLYIILRFRNWQFGFGAVVALLHDSIIVLGLFSLLYGILPFSLEIDQAFVAAILTVVGYSINDTVVIYDRIRENIGLYRKRDRAEIINLALNSTLSRTFSTSFSTFVVLLAIFLFGGEVIRGFTFALLIGILVGTYSSVFIASPIVYDTVKKAEDKKLQKAK